jgi:hypothetical protein
VIMLCRGKSCYFRLWGFVIVPILLTACGGSGSGGTGAGSNSQPVVLTGVFLDSLVSGINYSTATQSGRTNSSGEFSYIGGERATFSIGDIVLGSSEAASVITPIDLVDGANDATDPQVVNIVRLLMTLDNDGIPDNGIEITPAVHTAATGLSLLFGSTTFEADVQTLLDAAKGAGTQLVSVDSAQSHFNTSLKTSWGAMAWGTDCWAQVCP